MLKITVQRGAVPSKATAIAFLGKVTRRLVDEEMTVEYKAP